MRTHPTHYYLESSGSATNMETHLMTSICNTWTWDNRKPINSKSHHSFTSIDLMEYLWNDAFTLAFYESMRKAMIPLGVRSPLWWFVFTFKILKSKISFKYARARFKPCESNILTTYTAPSVYPPKFWILPCALFYFFLFVFTFTSPLSSRCSRLLGNAAPCHSSVSGVQNLALQIPPTLRSTCFLEYVRALVIVEAHVELRHNEAGKWHPPPVHNLQGTYI